MTSEVTLPVERRILLIRGRRVLVDRDLAKLYGVTTKNLNKAVRRNMERFPDDFMLQLSTAEADALRFQFGTSNAGRGGRRYLEQGVAMLSSVLRSRRAVLANIAIMRAFVKIREILASHADLVRRLDELEKKYDGHFHVVSDAIRQLMEKPPEPPPPPEEPEKEKIGFSGGTER